MGLAASQARFLAITARKMNCEFQSMQIAQNKLSVTRDLQKAAQDYQTALTTSKLVWDADDRCDGSGDVYDLSFGIMMTPSTLNEYDPYLVTDARGRILLTDQMFNAAVEAGIIYPNGNPKGKLDAAGNGTGESFRGVEYTSKTDGSRNAFLYQLSQRNQINPATLDSIYKLGETGYTKSGVGGKIFDKSTADAMRTNAFINYMEKATYKIYEDAGLKIPPGKDVNEKIYSLKLVDALKGIATLKDVDVVGTTILNNNQLVVTKGGSAIAPSVVNNLTLGEILKGDYAVTYKNKSGDSNSGDNDLFKRIVEIIGQVLGYGAGAGTVKGLNVDVESDLGLSAACALTSVNYASEYATYINDMTSGSISGLNGIFSAFSRSRKNASSVADLSAASKEQNNVIKGDNGLYSASLTNMIKSYLTNFALDIDGYDSGYQIDTKSAKNSVYVTNDNEYYFLVTNEKAVTEQDMLNAEFYNMLYNQIVMNGAISDSSIRELYTNDASMMQNAIKTGNLFISTLNNDGYFYQGPYTASGHVAEIPDEDAIARAELDYTITKAKLNSKEEGLEVQMKNLDMEISSLTTELDSVKNLISKNVEKVFNMFSS